MSSLCFLPRMSVSVISDYRLSTDVQIFKNGKITVKESVHWTNVTGIGEIQNLDKRLGVLRVCNRGRER